MGKITLVTGGARSGKSSFALDLAESVCEKPRLFIATCPAVDREMGERVVRHKAERCGRGWQTFEEELEPARLIAAGLPTVPGVVLLDCLTLWINNLLYQSEHSGGSLDDDLVAQRCDALIAAMAAGPHQYIVVSNEVGLGIVPDNPLARRYRDLVGTANQCFGRRAGRVVLVSCGVPLYLKEF